VTGQCRYAEDPGGNSSWLQISGGHDILPASASTSSLGLHVVDYNLAMGISGACSPRKRLPGSRTPQ
jgi:hypothetical protein